MQQPASPSPERTPQQRSRGWKRRIAKACDQCRRKRTKCSGTRPVCAQCSVAPANCHYSDAERQRPRTRSERARYVNDLEDRVRQLEAKLRRHESQSGTQHPTSATELRSDDATSHAQRSDNVGERAADGNATRSTVVVENTGELRYFGPSSSISILSPDGLQWLESRTADASLRQRLESPLKGGGSWAKWTHPVLQQMWPTTPSTPLPPWSEALSLVNDFFEIYNNILPIFHPPTFMGLLGKHYAHASSSIDDPAACVALNAVLAMAQRRRAEQAPESPELADQAWAYARNALEVALAVFMRSVSLLSVQAILALAWFFRGTPNPQPYFFLTAAAVRLCHSAGLHRGGDHLPVSSIDREQRLRVFWIAMVLDASASFRTGRPCTQSVDDIGVPILSDAPKDNLGIVVNKKGSAAMNILSARARLSLLEARVYERLFSATTSEKSIETVAADVDSLTKELDEWNDIVPGAADCNTIADGWNHQHPHILCLLIQFQNCVITLHSAPWQRQFTNSRTRRPSDRSSQLLPSSFPAKCLCAAHEIVKLISLLPRDAVSFIWEVIQCPVQACMVFFIHLVQQPNDSEADSHLRAMEDAIGVLSRLMTNQEDCFVRPVLLVCKELTRISQAAIHKSRSKAEAPQYEQDIEQQYAPASDQDTRPFDGYDSPRRIMSSHSLLSNPPPESTESQVGMAAYAMTSSAPDPFSLSTGHPTTETAFPAPSAVEQPIVGIDQLAELALPFPWNWQDLSAGLLEDFNWF